MSEFENPELIENLKKRFMDKRCTHIEQLMSIMSNPVRFHILCALNFESFTVTDLVELTGAKMSNISQQLKMMTLSGYLIKERRGKQIYYTLVDKRISRLISELEKLFPLEAPGVTSGV